ncbi:O-antigen polymerase [Polaribacter sp. IC063]|uniref:O-antigen polymerase n=1 Tax=Polaribacter sp. IC063 TaxID=57031 RepID=UPI0011BE35F4|nr:O-antigen polymerase [Polaribacter sp. IC063]TXD51438.1 oligosaccharide repeat unit polymerase [Polaribacter sp. IC063]
MKVIKLYKKIILLLIICLFFLKPELKSVISPRLMTFYSLIYIIALILHFFNYSSNKKKINWFRIDVFFLLGFSIVHFQWPVMYGISGVSPEFTSIIWVDENYVNYGTWASAVGGLAWVLGFSTRIFKQSMKKYFFYFKYNKLLNFTIGLFILFVITAGKSFLTGGVYKGDGGSSSGDGIAAYIQLLYSISIILLTAVIILDKKKQYEGNVFKWFLNFDIKFLILFFSYIILFLLIGDRGGPVLLFLTTSIIIGSIIKPINFRTLITTVAAGSIVLTLISLGRSEKSGIGIFTAGAEKFEFSSGYDNTLELANSIRTLYRAVSNVPERHNYFYGKLWRSDLLAIIPFSQSFFLSLTEAKRYEMSSSGYITYLTFGLNPHSGEGTSLIADIYLNFGILGVLFFMYLLGMFFKKIDVELYSNNNFKWLVVAAILASLSISLSRNGLFVMVRPVLWSLLLVSLLVKKRRILI